MFRGNILSVVLALLLAVPAAFAEDAAVASVAEAGPNAALVTPPAAPADRPAPISPQAREALSKSPLSKPVTTSTSPVAALEAAAAPTFDNPAVPLSGVVLMPTAYRGRGVNKIGPNLDINGAYFIGRLYGKNSLSWTTSKKNYLDRIGLWMLSLDAKMMVQTETTWRPAMAVGALGSFAFRDSGNAKLNTTGNTTVSVNSASGLASAYVAFSKRPHKRLITTVGYMEGSMADQLPMLSEYLSKEALELDGDTGEATSRYMAFANVLWLLKPDFPIGAEIMIPQGAARSPKLINLHLGNLLKMNFELSYLTYTGGWDLLGMFQFRYNYFPR